MPTSYHDEFPGEIFVSSITMSSNKNKMKYQCILMSFRVRFLTQFLFWDYKSAF